MNEKGLEAAGSVCLLGAGCQSADLITVRGLKRLQGCDAVVYDDLIDPVLLEYVPKDAQKIYMGKRKGKHSATQQEICEQLIALAREGKRVVRLKGGDPFVFGRGGEEAMALRAAGIAFETVPGISSAIAIPAEAGISLTMRGISRGIHIVTGHGCEEDPSFLEELRNLAKLSGTLVILMGLSRLPQIVQVLLAAGKEKDTPAAVISGGNAPHPSTVRAALGALVKEVEAHKVQPPAVIVIGEVAAVEHMFLPDGENKF